MARGAAAERAAEEAGAAGADPVGAAEEAVQGVAAQRAAEEAGAAGADPVAGKVAAAPWVIRP